MATFLFNLQDGITHIRGTLRRNDDGTRLEARTDSHGRTRLYLMPKYKRSTPVSDAEIAGRNRFACIARMIRQRRMAGDKRPHKLLWDEAAAEYDAIRQRPATAVAGK